MKPEISIIMPVYNSKKYIEKAINSIINQSFNNFELILVDDGSIDGTAIICDNYAKKDNRIKVYHKENGGICNDDDEYLKDAIKDNYEKIIKYDADIVKFGMVEDLCIDDKVVKTLSKTNYDFKIYENNIVKNILYFFCQEILFYIWDGIYKKEVLENFNEKFLYGMEDTFLMFKIFQKVKKVVLNNGIYYRHYLRQKHSTSASYHKENLKLIKYFYDEFTNDVSKNEYLNEKKAEFNIITTMYFLNPIITLINQKQFKFKINDKVRILKKFKPIYKKELFINEFKINKKVAMENLFLKKGKYIFYIEIKYIINKLRGIK